MIFRTERTYESDPEKDTLIAVKSYIFAQCPSLRCQACISGTHFLTCASPRCLTSV